MTDKEQRDILAKNLLWYLNAAGKTQKELAEAIGVTAQAVNTWCQAQTLPRMGKVQKIAEYLHIKTTDLIDEHHGIPLYGRVAAGEPLEMIPEIKYMDNEYERNMGEYFALVIHGDSMAPDIQDGDTAIIRRQDDAESGDIVIATINGDEATCKRLRLLPDGIELIPNNPAYSPFEFNAEQVARMPVRIIGKVVEVRRKICG